MSLRGKVRAGLDPQCWPSSPPRAARPRETAGPAARRQKPRLRRGGSRIAHRACSGRWRAWRGTCCSDTPALAVSPVSARIARADQLGDAGGGADPAQVVGDIEIGLIKAERFDQRGEVGERSRGSGCDTAVIDLEARRTKTARGTAACAVTDGIAERTPNMRAS